MAVRIRLSRFGRLHRPYFRIVAIDGRCHREGVSNEIIGSYDPALTKEKGIQIDLAKVEKWVNKGAQISDGLRSLLRFAGHAIPKAPAKPAAAKTEKKKAAAKPAPTAKKTYVAPTRRSLLKHKAKAKAQRKTDNEQKLAAHKAAKAAATPAAEAPPA